MVRISRKNIVETESILSDQAINEMNFYETMIDEHFLTNDAALLFLAKYRLIPNTRTCIYCQFPTMLSLRKESRCVDGYIWACRRPCTYSTSIRSDSFFYESKLKIKTIVKIMYKYVNGVEFDDISHDLQIKPETASLWADLVREAICCHINQNSNRIGGLNDDGTRKVVEIDESLFSRRKYNRGRIQDQQWYVGGIERNSRNCFLIPVPNRNAETMARLIAQYVNPGSLVVTDKWRAYSEAIKNLDNITHETINHSIHFVDPLNRLVHTQNIEGFFSRSKYFIRKKRGISREKQSEYLIQFIWQYSVKKRERFSKLLIMLQWNNE